MRREHRRHITVFLNQHKGCKHRQVVVTDPYRPWTVVQRRRKRLGPQMASRTEYATRRTHPSSPTETAKPLRLTSSGDPVTVTQGAIFDVSRDMSMVVRMLENHLQCSPSTMAVGQPEKSVEDARIVPDEATPVMDNWQHLQRPRTTLANRELRGESVMQVVKARHLTKTIGTLLPNDKAVVNRLAATESSRNSTQSQEGAMLCFERTLDSSSEKEGNGSSPNKMA